MSEPELWQVYDERGEPLSGVGETAEAFSNDHRLFMGNSHAWLWRSNEGTRQILLQRRAKHLIRKPGYLHASAAGHVNLGESPVRAAIRELDEEIAVHYETAELTPLFELKGGARGESFNFVFLAPYGARTAVVNPNEVDELLWVDVETFREMTLRPDQHRLIDLGEEYYGQLIASLQKL